MEERLEKEIKRSRWHRTWMVIALLLLVLVIGSAAFSYFHITTQARLIFRRGKNVKLALDMLDIELYAKKQSVYDAKKPDKMAAGIEKQVYDIVEQKGKTEIVSYDTAAHKITYLIYEEENYRVIYQYDEENGDLWRVDYLFTLLNYSD